MQSDVWRALLRRIPEEHHNNLMAMTTAGTEINVQTVLRLEDDFVVLRGRLAGSTDMGRVFFLPYGQIDHVGFLRPLSDAQVQAVFDGTAASAPPSAETPPAPEAPPAAAVPEPPPAAPPAPPPTGLLARLPSKSEVIQRLRLRSSARAAAGGTKEAPA
jgi:hypothetical protein